MNPNLVSVWGLLTHRERLLIQHLAITKLAVECSMAAMPFLDRYKVDYLLRYGTVNHADSYIVISEKPVTKYAIRKLRHKLKNH